MGAVCCSARAETLPRTIGEVRADQETVQVSDSVPDPKLRPYVYIDDTISGAKRVYTAKGICCRRLLIKYIPAV